MPNTMTIRYEHRQHRYKHTELHIYTEARVPLIDRTDRIFTPCVGASGAGIGPSLHRNLIVSMSEFRCLGFEGIFDLRITTTSPRCPDTIDGLTLELHRIHALIGTSDSSLTTTVTIG